MGSERLHKLGGIMEIKAELLKPYTKEQRIKFIVENNHKKGYKVEETELSLVALDETEEEKEEKEKERISMLSLTKREIFLALYKDKGLKPEEIRNQIVDVEALIEFDYANSYYRGNPLVDKIGKALGYSSEDLDYLFENKKLLAKEVEDV